MNRPRFNARAMEESSDMSTVHSVDDFLVTGTLENENTLMTDYWLEFVAARDGGNGCSAAAFEPQEAQINSQQFSERMEEVLRKQERVQRRMDPVSPDAKKRIWDQTIYKGAVDYQSDPTAVISEGRNPGGCLTVQEQFGSGLFARGKSFFSNRLRCNPLFRILSR